MSDVLERVNKIIDCYGADRTNALANRFANIDNYEARSTQKPSETSE